MKTTLTTRQREIYEFLRDKILNRGYGPTVREIGVQFAIRSPNGVMCHLKALEKKGLITRESHMSRAIQLCDSPGSRMALPLAGTIAAGNPVLAVQQDEKVDFSPLFNPDHYVLKVRGDSMIEEQIAEGDFAIIRKQDEARDGDIVVARVDGQDATLKRFFRETHRIRLEPANSKMKPIYSSRVDVEGILVGVIRKYQSK